MIYPATFLRCMKPEDRASLGVAGLLPEELIAKAQAKNERQLQGQIVQYLRLCGIEPLWHRTDKKSAATKGWPDITFCWIGNWKRWPCAWEVKFGDGQLSDEQSALFPKLLANGWHWRIIRSLDQAIKTLKEMGVQPE